MPPVQTRIGVAALTKMAFDGADLAPLWYRLLEDIAQTPSNAAAVMDMSVIAQLLGDQNSGLALQSAALKFEPLYRLNCSAATPRLKVLAFAAPTDIGGNTPIDFLIEDSGVELYTLYVVPDMPLPSPLPEHDIAFVAAPGSESTRDSLFAIGELVSAWPRPVLNAPPRIAELDRDRLHVLLTSLPGVEMPMTRRITREQLARIGLNKISIRVCLDDGTFPLIVRPIDSHAGRGLARIEQPSEIEEYLVQRHEDLFFLSRFVDYSSPDGLFRKYRIVFIDGRPYACHMAISDQWKIWYLNADMAESVGKRAEEERFMTTFDETFAQRHGTALVEIARRVGLEYFAIDCAETKAGKLLLFEADNAMIVHNMDPASLFPYKPPQMRKIFGAFVAMLDKYAGQPSAKAA